MFYLAKLYDISYLSCDTYTQKDTDFEIHLSMRHKYKDLHM